MATPFVEPLLVLLEFFPMNFSTPGQSRDNAAKMFMFSVLTPKFGAATDLEASSETFHIAPCLQRSYRETCACLFYHFGGALTSLREHCAMSYYYWVVAAIVSQYRAIWGHYGHRPSGISRAVPHEAASLKVRKGTFHALKESLEHLFCESTHWPFCPHFTCGSAQTAPAPFGITPQPIVNRKWLRSRRTIFFAFATSHGTNAHRTLVDHAIQNQLNKCRVTLVLSLRYDQR